MARFTHPNGRRSLVGFDKIDSERFQVETWVRKSYGSLRGPVKKTVSRNEDGTFRPSTNRSPETPFAGLATRV